MVFSSAMTMIMWTFFPDDFAEDAPDLSGEPWAWRVMFSMFDYFELLIVLQFVLAVAGICGGIGLLKLKPWGRLLTEILTWLGLLYTISFSILWLLSVASMGGGNNAPEEMRYFGLMMFVMGLVMFLAFLVPFVVVLVALRGKTIRAAVQQGAHGDLGA